MRIRVPVVFIVAAVVGLAACGKRAEEAPAAAQTAQTSTESKGAEGAAASGQTTNFESQQQTPAPAPSK